ncbi:peptidylprolyl isomerase [Pajaroellobacter abortibovis]|uniref:PpiC domain-containing protein n=1 Tax=Pajaroellobacter abortibovis TaxID=1882918 RepID=A0A1L6MX67_9BACT|nr:peptidylprolyl isomerase [Pajaroellobacter abortibovis]APS00153.1 hypothetical protein BCY86_05260 [Pajaroellobacter abortibovis]
MDRFFYLYVLVPVGILALLLTCQEWTVSPVVSHAPCKDCKGGHFKGDPFSQEENEQPLEIVESEENMLEENLQPSLEQDGRDKAASTIRIGFILITHIGAQNAPPHTRSLKDAQKLANQLALLAKSDFAAAVAQGDTESQQDTGPISRGVLEPTVEQNVLRLSVGEVSQPIATSRGYWIVKRLE